MMEMRQEIEALGTMTATELRRRYAEAFGEPTRSGNRRWMARRIAWRLQAQAEGGLTERAKRRAEALARDEDIRLRPPADFADRGPALGVALRTVSGTVVKRDDRVPIPGTVLTRSYKGVEHAVTVLPNGFEHAGKTYRSLSAAAHAITGSHWNGYYFFGLTKPGKDGDER